ncbi:MAG: pyridoxamine 5'-phosphate oxidase family protein [Spirochaetaceae bacterium]|jgi:nitroimidazol reductase NimA-like FMN-containing flavoprotein (pyridoxamine 5'-phosphate oxidase superfamily)|nr:pyridoxamine 5'-phosphate oxidase family protein [Spirochaetaceae bacterium]
MYRKDREITDIAAKIAVIDRCKVCRLGLAEDNRPYIVPVNYGYRYVSGVLTVYIHGAARGKKWEIIKKNNAACFEVDGAHQLIEADNACNYAFAYESVIGFGHIAVIDADAKEEKVEALNVIMKHQTGKEVAHHFSDAALDAVAVYMLPIDDWTGKQRKMV